MFYIILNSEEERNKLMSYLKEQEISAVFHYTPLHSSKMGRKYGYKEEDLLITQEISKRIIRLPFYYDLTRNEQEYIIKNIKEFLTK